jgi:hypothetical protein
MSEDQDDDFEGAPRRFKVALFIVHPTITPSEITSALALEGHSTHRAGDQRKTPKGTILNGVYPDNRWRHSIRYEVRDQWFADKLVVFVDQLLPHKTFFHHMEETGGSAEILLQFLGDGYFGDDIPPETLMRMSELRVKFGIEVFMVPQSEY